MAAAARAPWVARSSGSGGATAIAAPAIRTRTVGQVVVAVVAVAVVAFVQRVAGEEEEEEEEWGQGGRRRRASDTQVASFG